MTIYNDEPEDLVLGDLRLWATEDLENLGGIYCVTMPAVSKELRRRKKLEELHSRFWGKTVTLREDSTLYVVQFINPETFHLTVKELGGTITRTVTYGNAEVQW